MQLSLLQEAQFSILKNFGNMWYVCIIVSIMWANSFSKLQTSNFQFKMPLKILFFYNGRFWNWLIIIWPADKEAISQSRKAAHTPMKQAESALVQSDCAWSKSASNVVVYIKHKHHFRLKYQYIYCHKLMMISNVNCT